MHSLAGNSSVVLTPEDLITGEKQIVTKDIIVEDGEGVVPKYSVMGIVTASGESKLSLTASSDGSEVPDHITCDECDATSAAANVGAYFEGCFNPALLNIGTGHTIASITPALRGKGIHLSTVPV